MTNYTYKKIESVDDLPPVDWPVILKDDNGYVSMASRRFYNGEEPPGQHWTWTLYTFGKDNYYDPIGHPVYVGDIGIRFEYMLIPGVPYSEFEGYEEWKGK